MKKRLPSFAAGMLTMALIGGLTVSALAATGGVTFNASNLVFNGAQISAKGEDYALSNGCMAPSSITYTDEKGGGTTYLPVRRISELLGVETGWDGATGSVTVKGDVKTPDTPDNTAAANYDDWTPEEEAAYQEFKGLWEVKVSSTNNEGIVYAVWYKGSMTDAELIVQFQQVNYKAYAERLAWENYPSKDAMYMVFYGAGPGLGSVLIKNNKLEQGFWLL